jgi:cell division protein FtsB
LGVPPTTPPTHRGGLTTRSAILGLVFCALVVSAALPLREYLSQRGQIAEAQHKQALQRERVKQLEQQLRQLQDPAYVKAEARSRLHFVLPGETPYVLLTPSAAPLPSGTGVLAGTTATGPESPWYSQLWASVRAADAGPRPTRAPKP